MAKISRRQLRKLILKEFQKMKEDALIRRHKDPGRQAFSKSLAYKCYECGYTMKEGDMCEQCGGKMYEMENLNEGNCGCGTCAGCDDSSYKFVDHDHDDDFIPDHMTLQGGHDMDQMQQAMFDRFLHMKHINVEFDYDDEDVKIGNHKVFKGSYMAKTHLHKVHKYAEKLYHMIPDGHNLEDWMRSKIAQIADDIGEVYHALDHDIYEGDI